MLRTVFLISLIALLAALYLPINHDTLLSKLFSGSSEQGAAVKERSNAADHSDVTSYASTVASLKPSETYTASDQDYTDPRTQTEHHSAAPEPPSESSPDGQPLLPGPDEIPADDAAILSEEAQLETLGPIIVNSDGTLSRIDNWKDMTKSEKAMTLKRLKKRNAQRLKQLKEQKAAGSLDSQD
ncbi:hypothetical protein M407DRAFT_20486 [Tulasnella calospora MUT 4182]|uniref:Uncharacterized protein n=1 Tax=Tulasnella calospora MUT 4182 TaxID=1051891 RepID=A0A0C3M9Q4_9AGAM|nr:hypothetical protein M407DRAFT_20486 [Tulasnella calospora MUT 4182]